MVLIKIREPSLIVCGLKSEVRTQKKGHETSHFRIGKVLWFWSLGIGLGRET